MGVPCHEGENKHREPAIHDPMSDYAVKKNKEGEAGRGPRTERVLSEGLPEELTCEGRRVKGGSKLCGSRQGNSAFKDPEVAAHLVCVPI